MSRSVSTPRRGLRRILTVLGISTAALVIGAGSAMAHVSVTPGEAAAGAYTKLTFRVPNESKTDATTDSITITLPSDTPFASVRAKQTPGWTSELTKTTLPAPVEVNGTNLTEAVTTVTFTADAGNGIKVGEFAEFDISVGPVPQADVINFPTAQAYSDGTVVNWDEVQAEGAEEPAHPVPSLKVTGEATGDAHGGTTDAAAAAHEDEDSSLPLIFGIAGTVLGLLGLGVAVVALRGRAKTAA